MRPLPLAAIICGLLALASTSRAEDSAAPQVIPLQSPLTTLVAAPSWPSQESLHYLSAVITVPPDAPSDLGVGVWVSDFDGHWYQRLQPQPLNPGRHKLHFTLQPQDWVHSEGHRRNWDPLASLQVRRGGLMFWSQQPSGADITVEQLRAHSSPPAASAAAPQYRVHGLDLELNPSGQWVAPSGQRLEFSFLPQPLPQNPFDPGLFSATAVFTHQDGSVQRVPAFWQVAMDLHDRGDQEVAVPAAPGRFVVRFRPRQPGSYSVHLEAHWDQPQRRSWDPDGHAQATAERSGRGHSLRWPLPQLQVHGEAWNDYVVVDPDDPRFFSVDGEFFWPVGINIRSVNDSRGAERTQSQVTVDRGSRSYEAYLERFAAAGGTAVEIWMSSWNLALEWRGDWPEYDGLGRYSQARAQRLDAILDHAYALGIRINLVVRNHGQASERTDREWHHNAFNREHGGIVDDAEEFFRDPQALDYQYRLHRYLVGRYADHPAIMGWKLWSEVNLTAGRRDDVRRWHEITAAQFLQLDGYPRAVTTHWSGDYRQPDRVIVAQEGIGYVCIDAYHGRRDGRGTRISDLMWASTQAPGPGRGLMQFGKPVLVTEFGGNWNAAPIPQLLAEHQSAPWAALVAGHAGAPMLWWFEWVDQNDLWAPYQALSRFLQGEDLRHPNARAATLRASDSGLWAAAWVRPGHILGYLMDQDWGFDGSPGQRPSGAEITIGDSVSAGELQLEWWNADNGSHLSSQRVSHPGGQLRIQSPGFARHVAFKLKRLPAASAQP